jgi:hypothetical protein
MPTFWQKLLKRKKSDPFVPANKQGTLSIKSGISEEPDISRLMLCINRLICKIPSGNTVDRSVEIPWLELKAV